MFKFEVLLDFRTLSACPWALSGTRHKQSCFLFWVAKIWIQYQIFNNRIPVSLPNVQVVKQSQLLMCSMFSVPTFCPILLRKAVVFFRTSNGLPLLKWKCLFFFFSRGYFNNSKFRRPCDSLVQNKESQVEQMATIELDFFYFFFNLYLLC